MAVRIALLGVLALMLSACGALPALEDRPASQVELDTADTRLGRSIAPMAAAHPGDSGIYALIDAHDAYAARVLLARAAERTLDAVLHLA